MTSEFYNSGKKYISAKRASKLTGYARDYIGQLARSGKLDAQLVGRSWFVAEDSLLGYKQSVIEENFSSPSAKKRAKISAKKLAEKSSSQTITEPPIIDPVLEVPISTAQVPHVAEAIEPLPALGVRPASPKRKLIQVPRTVRVVRALNVIGSASSSVRIRRRKSKALVPSLKAGMELVVRPVAELAKPIQEKSLMAAVRSPYAVDPNLFRAAGNLFMSSAVAFTLLLVVASSGSLYQTSEESFAKVGTSIAYVSERVEQTIAKSPVYMDAGLAAAVKSVTGGEGTERLEMARERFSLSGLARAFVRKFNSSAVAFYEAVNSIFTDIPFVDVKVTRLATNAETSGKNREGIVVVPSTGNDAKDEAIEKHIRNSFSDEVVIEQDDDGTGVIKPVFKSGKEDEYIYVLVPIEEGG